MHQTFHIFMFYFSSRKKMPWCPSHVDKLPWCPFYIADLPPCPCNLTMFEDNFIFASTKLPCPQRSLFCTLNAPFLWFSGILMWGVSQIKVQDFESSVKVGDCIFIKIYVLGQNVAWGRFSRFLASYLFITVVMYSAWKILSSSTSPWNLSSLWQLVYP